MTHIYGQFDGYALRSVDDSDYSTLERWIAGDRYHAGIFDPDHFIGRAIDERGRLAPDPRATCYALEDDHGTLFYIRLARAARVAIQFDTGTILRNRARVSRGLLHGMAFLEAGLSLAGAEEWIFDTEDRGLTLLAKRHLGFVESPNEMVRLIERPKVGG